MVKRGALEDVWNSEFYKTIFLQNRKRLRSNSFGVIKLGTVCSKITKGETPREGYQNTGILFVKSENVLQNELDIDSTDFVNEAVHKRMNRSQLKRGDVLFNIVGASIGRACVFDIDEEANINQAVSLIRLKSNDYLPNWLSIILNSEPYLLWINQLKSGGARDNIDLGQVNSFEIPKHTKELQSQIVEIFNTAYSEKRQKEAEAKELLASIDAYLLEQLGIVLPNKIEDKNVFYVPFSKVQGKRFDPKPYISVNQALYESLSNSKYQKESLKNLLIQSVAGDWGIEENKEGFEERLVIRATEFDNLYNLNLENSRVKYRFINQVKLGKMDLQVGDLLIEKSGGSENQPVGRIALITKDIANQYKLAYSNFIHKIRVSDQINPEYLFYFLKTIHNIKITDLMQSQTNGIRNLIMREYFNIPVSLPPLEIQTEIANHIRNIRERAKTLENKAEEVIEKAKAEIEKMILG